MKNIKKHYELLLTPSGPGFFDQPQPGGISHLHPSKIWSAWASVMKPRMHIAQPIANSITYFLEPRG